MRVCSHLTRQVRQAMAVAAVALIAPNLYATPSVEVSVPDTRVAPEEFPIFPWDRLGTDLKNYEEARECGFNVAGFVTPDRLDLPQKAGLKCFLVDPLVTIRDNMTLSDAEITSNVKAVLSRVGNHPAVLGYHLMDEPTGAQLPTAAKWVNAFHQADPNTTALVNLLPYFEAGKPHHLDISYNDYLTSFVQMAKPRAFSYDNYVVMDDGTIRPTFYQNLEIAREVSQKSGVPFWFVGLSNAHFRYAEPTYATFRFQVFSTLAYGVKGIGWFTYTARDRGNYRNTAIDYDGRRTPTWDMLRAANMQIHRLAPVYTKLKSVNVFHHPQVPAGCRGIESSRYLKDLPGKGQLVVGEFESPDGKPYFLIVNKSLTRSTDYKVHPKLPGKIMRVSSFTGAIGPWSAENNWLAPGQGALLFLDDSQTSK